MTKKNLIALAEKIRANKAAFSDVAINAIADFCAAQNPAFKRERFLGYINGVCGPNGGRR